MTTAHCSKAKIVADFSTKPIQGNVLVIHRNTTQGVNKEDFIIHKEWCKSALQRNDLWDDLEDDLMNL